MSKTKKDEIVANIAKKNGISKKQAREIFDDIFNGIANAVNDNGSFSIVGFGTFKKVFKSEKEYNGFGSKIVVPKHYTVKFSAGKKFKEAVNSKKN